MTVELLTLPKLIAHRGASAYVPENTLAAVRKAHALGAKWIEFDVMLSGCGEAIIIHDSTLKRTTNGHGRVGKMPYADIIKLDAGSWFAPQFAGEKVPTLIEFLHCAAELKLGINVEIKPTRGMEQVTAQKALELLQNHWPAELPLLVSSGSALSLKTLRTLDKNVSLGFILHHWGKAWKKILKQYNCISLHVNHQILAPTKVAKIKQIVPHVLAYTVNNSQRAQELFEWGVDAVFTDYPDM